MNTFKQKLLQNKSVAVWGMGYLGYTAVLKLNECGFKTTVWDFDTQRLEDIVSNKYPRKEQLNSWSKSGKFYSLNKEDIRVAKSTTDMFDNTVHLICFPHTQKMSYKKIAQIFIENRSKISNCLIVFQSAGKPGTIESEFCDYLDQNEVKLDIATVFRSDWNIEDFLTRNDKKTISWNNALAIEKVNLFLQLLQSDCVTLRSIEEAEVCENAKTSLNYIIIAFINQLSLAYPHIDSNHILKILLQTLDVSSLKVGVSSVDYKSEQAIENILLGSQGDFLSILKEASNTNISFLFYYVNILQIKKITSVTIFGLSTYNSLKDIKFSPSFILAEYLHKSKIEISIYDDCFTADELSQLMPYAKVLNPNNEIVQTEAVIIMSLTPKIKFFTQTHIDKIRLSSVKYLFDNTGFFKTFDYSKETIYHQFGDSNLVKVIH